MKENNRLIDMVAVYPSATERAPRRTEIVSGGLYTGTEGYRTGAFLAFRRV